jgi:primosomal protein N' (replication factor Y) (superfamily II helicase)
VAAPLKLKRQQTAQKPKSKSAADLFPVAAVLVDTPVSHLEGVYDYLVPLHLEDSAVYGTKVVVPFGNTQVDGLIVGRKNDSQQIKNLKMIVDVTSPSGLISSQVIEHLELVRNRFGGSFWSLLKSALPARVAKEDKMISDIRSPSASETYESPQLRDLIGRSDYGMLIGKQRLKWAINLPIGISSSNFVNEIIKLRARTGQVLVIVPDEKDLLALKNDLKKFFGTSFLELGTHLGKSDRYKNFLIARFSRPSLIVSTRSGVFTDLEENSTVVVLSDLDQSHYEQHSPGWNTRDVSLLRSKDTSLLFISASHSMEISRLIEIGWLEKKNYRNKNGIQIVTGENGRSFVSSVKKGIAQGNVLVTVAEKGYANLFLCAKCRNTANCKCGGKLQIQGANSVPTCYLCDAQQRDWKCQYCGESKPYVISKGIDRNAEEIGRAIPKASILISSGSKQIADLPNGKHVVLATAGSEPNGRYSSLVLLDGERMFSRPSLRAEEFAKFQWFSSFCKVLPNSEVFVTLQNHHPVVQSMLKADSNSGASLELINREKAKLPPFYRVAVIIGSNLEISKFAENLRSSKDYEITGPVKFDQNQSKLIIRVKLEEGGNLVDLLDDVSKIQGVKGRQIFKIRVDPYDI